MKPKPLLDGPQMALLKESFAVLAADAEGATMALFKRLFELDPRLRFLFPEELADQKHRLMSMIGYIIRRIDRWDQVEPRLRNLGLRHVSYGAKPSDYRTFEQAMRDVLSDTLKLDQDSETIQVWSTVFRAVSQTMIDAAEAGTESRLAFESA